MAELVVLGAGLSGTLMAYELLPKLRNGEDRVTVIGQGPRYHFVPSNPWVAVGWREKQDIEVDIADVMQRKGIRYFGQGARRVLPRENRIELEDGTSVAYDYLVVATGPDLAFDEIPGLGPDGETQSICHVDHATRAKAAFERFVRGARPDRRRCGTGRIVLRPGLRVRLHPRYRVAKASYPRPRSDDLRDVGTLHRPPRPRRRRRYQGPARERDARPPHQMDHECARHRGRTRQDAGRGSLGIRRGREGPRTAVQTIR